MQPVSKKIIIITVVINVVLSICASDIYLPSLPAITHSLMTTHTAVKLTVTLYFIGFSVTQLIYGPLSDAIGRRSVLIAGLIITLIGSFFCALSQSIDWLIIGRFIQGAGAGAGFSLSRSVIRDVMSGKEMSRVASICSNFTALAPAAAPIVGGYIQHYTDWHVSFILVGLMGLGALIFIIKCFPETIASKNKSAIHPVQLGKNYAKLFINPVFMGYSLLSGFLYGTLFLYLSLSPFLFQNVLHLNTVVFGWLGLSIGIGLIVGSYINLYLLKYFEIETIALIGILILGLSGIAMLIPYLFHALNIAVVIIPVIISVISAKLIFICAFTLALKDLKHMAGTAGALYSVIQITGPIIGTAIASIIHIQTQLPIAIAFLIAFGLCLLAFGLTKMHLRKPTPLPKD